MCGSYIKAHVLDVPYHADFEYTYFVPSEYRSEIELGSAIVVPFGYSNRKKSAVVVDTDVKDVPNSATVKTIHSLLSGYFKLSPEMMELCRFMKEQTLCTFGEAIRCIIPSAILTKTKETYRVNEDSCASVPSYTQSVYDFIKENPSVTMKRLKEKLGEVQLEVSRLVRDKLIIKETSVEASDKNKYETRVKLTCERELAAEIADGRGPIKLRSRAQAEVLRLLCEYGELSDKEIYSLAEASKANLDSLEKKELIKTWKIEISRNPYANLEAEEKEPVILNDEQETAYNTLKELYYTRKPKAALLYGITGSGKTSVIKKMIDEVIEDGRGVIVLVPEISLTPQTVKVFCGFYGKRVAVIHSSLSAGERFDTYKKIADGRADIVIGTRSAIFAPVKNLGMIVIDEEQEHTYKSDTNPKYLAHDIARFRCAKSNALMLLASATPSLTSYYKAKSGVYTLIKLAHRYGEATLPEVIITDMRREKSLGNKSAYGDKLARLLANGIEANKQSILFLNRRGYHSSISCQSCGKPIECPNCSVAMTYHTYRRITDILDADNAREIMGRSGVLKCHYCGHRAHVPEKCSECGEDNFSYVGVGTQKAEEELSLLFPDIKTLRLDADTTTTKSSYEEILGAFREKQADVLIGTQMVTKGHNFPLVTLVGVMLADTMLYTSDFRASERTFSMLTQVIGRAGRASDKGTAVIQTNSPNDLTISLAAKQDYEAFYENEIQIRRAYTFPPFCDLAVLTLSQVDEIMLSKNAEMILKRLETRIKELGVPAIAYGPFDAPVYKTQGRYRKRIIVKCKLTSALRRVFSDIYIDYTRKSDKNFLSIDFNPSSI